MHVMSFGRENAPPLLLLHGGGVAGWMWNSLRQRLEAAHTVRARSPRPRPIRR